MLRRFLSPLASAIGALAYGITVLPTSGAQAGEIAVTCSNPVSGANFQIGIDYDRSTVDSNPARISDSKITWHDAKDNGNYTLDRTTGELTIIVASSTGGAFFYERCKLEQ
jgi:hypothetical protein